MDSIDEKSVDKRVKLYKSICGIIPGGSFIVEYMIDRIPDQRMERLFDFISELNERIDRLENKNFAEDEEFSFLAEKSIIESTQAQSKKRLKWLAFITIPFENCTSTLEWEYRMKAVSILSNLSDADVEYLLKYNNLSELSRYEHKKGQEKDFISDGERQSLPEHELFMKNLSNKQIDFYKNSLLNQGLLHKTIDRSSVRFNLTEEGRMFIYIISGNYPKLM